jgi:hypothetical protein
MQIETDDGGLDETPGEASDGSSGSVPPGDRDDRRVKVRLEDVHGFRCSPCRTVPVPPVDSDGPRRLKGHRCAGWTLSPSHSPMGVYNFLDFIYDRHLRLRR